MKPLKRSRFFVIVSYLSLLAVLSGCGRLSVQVRTPSFEPSPTLAVIVSPAVETPMPVPSATEAPAGGSPTQSPAIPTIEPAASATTEPLAATPGGSQANPDTLGDYLDDRSTAIGVVLSLMNAINRREYLRAYSYWEIQNGEGGPGTYDQFQKGYENTASVEVTTGTVGGDAGAGQFYYSVPVVLVAKTTGGETQTYAGCYILHQSNPGVQGEPPFQPMGIRSGALTQVANGSNKSDLLANACSGPGMPSTSPIEPAPTTNPSDISASNYLDDRSDPVEVLRSLFNALNRKEFVRAYSYWQNPDSSTSLPPFSQYVEGYKDLESVEVTFGSVTGDAGAGQLRYRVPAVLTVQTTGGQVQTFSACYQLHLSQPSVQGVPPFQPLGIELAHATQVASDADKNALLSSTCASMP